MSNIKHLFTFSFLCLIIIIGCTSEIVETAQTSFTSTVFIDTAVIPTSQIKSPTPTMMNSTKTKPIVLIKTPTPTPALLVTEREANQVKMLQTNGCVFPCIWGITPGDVGIDRVNEIAYTNNLNIFEGQDEYLSLSAVKDNVGIVDIMVYHVGDTIKGVEIDFSEPQSNIPLEDWEYYSPQGILEKYGQPEDIRFFVDLRNFSKLPNSFGFYYRDFVVAYSGFISLPVNNKLKVCPSKYEVVDIKLQTGEWDKLKIILFKPSFKDATNEELMDSYQRYRQDPENFCWTLDYEAFLP